jgi:ABC-type polysaccharide/polyol phosphate transport system ATPase subunit
MALGTQPGHWIVSARCQLGLLLRSEVIVSSLRFRSARGASAAAAVTLKKALREIFMRHIMRPMEPGPAAINVHELTRRFGESLAVNRLSFDVASGAICGVVGPNGAGKSTTFRILCGLLRPSSGVVRVHGRDVTRDPSAVGTCVGLLPETPHFYPYLTGERNLRALAGVSLPPVSDARCAELLQFTGLAKAASRAVSGYSAGMKQRLAPRRHC